MALMKVLLNIQSKIMVQRQEEEVTSVSEEVALQTYK